MKIIFAGTPEFAATALSAIHADGHHVALVLTQPDRPSGRGMKLTPSAVAQRAAELNLQVEKPHTLKSSEAQSMVAAANAAVMVVAAYGLLLPASLLKLPLHGCINIHASLLPRWRGAAPIQRAIEAGDARTGIAIMQMEAGLDTGPILLERPIEIAIDETSASLLTTLGTLGAEAVVEALRRLNTLTPRPQAEADVTYAKKLEKSEAPIDWSQSARLLERRIRAFDPFPGAETIIAGERIKIWRAAVADNSAAGDVGSVIAVSRDDFAVRCGEGVLHVTFVQRAGGRRIAVRDFLQSFPLSPGQQCT